MEGYSLWLKDGRRPAAKLSMTSVKVLSAVLREAGLVDDVKRCVIRCEKDHDFKCQENGCLQGHMVGHVLDIRKFLAVHERTREWLQDNPGFDSGAESERANPGKNGEIHSPGDTDFDRALIIVEGLIEILRELVGKQEKEVVYSNEVTKESVFPCARQIDLYGPITKEGKEDIVEVERGLLDYEYAKSNQEELEELRETLLTRKEAIKSGMFFVQIEEAKKCGIIFVEDRVGG